MSEKWKYILLGILIVVGVEIGVGVCWVPAQLALLFAQWGRSG